MIKYPKLMETESFGPQIILFLGKHYNVQKLLRQDDRSFSLDMQ